MSLRTIRGSRHHVDVSGSEITLDSSVMADLSELSRRSEVLGTDNQAAAQTGKLLCQPAAGRRLVITGLLLSTDTAMSIRLIEAGEDIVPPIYLGAPGSGNPIFVPPLRLGLNHSLQYTSSAAGNHSVAAYGWEE